MLNTCMPGESSMYSSARAVSLGDIHHMDVVAYAVPSGVGFLTNWGFSENSAFTSAYKVEIAQ